MSQNGGSPEHALAPFVGQRVTLVETEADTIVLRFEGGLSFRVTDHHWTAEWVRRDA